MNKSIIITGSSRGIGFAMAQEFLSLGHNVILNARSEASLQRAMNQITSGKGKFFGIVGDVAKAETHQQLLQKANQEFGGVDIYINNAGIPQSYSEFWNLENPEIMELNAVNISGLMLGTKLAAAFMLEQGHGHIFNMEGYGSDGRVMPKMVLYGTSKRAVNYFSKATAMELKATPVKLSVMSPGMVRTDFIDVDKSKMTAKEIQQMDKVYRILAEDVETVVPFLTQGVLRAQNNYEKIRYLSGFRLFSKIIKLMFSK